MGQPAKSAIGGTESEPQSSPRASLQPLPSGPRAISPALRARRRALLIALAAALLVPLTIRICLVGLERPSLGHRDERVHVQAVQEMYQSGRWWLPTVNGTPYFHKPPFKMWVSLAPVALLGESTRSYRLVDGAAGALTSLFVFLFCVRYLGSVLAGATAVIALLGCYSYIFNHGVRTAVQDSMLVLLCTVALMTGFSVAERVRRTTNGDLPPGTLLRAAMSGAAIGCAVLTKSAAGLMPLIVLGAYALVSGLIRPLLGRARRVTVTIIVLALAIPALYLVPHFIFTPRAFQVMVGQEVVDRATSGFHNKDDALFYYTRLVRDRVAVPPELLLVAVGAALVRAVRRRDARAQFLLVWVVVPIALFSAAPSRLTWYVAPTFPAMAILVGGLVATVTRRLRRDILESEILGARALGRSLACGAVLALAVVGLTRNIDTVLAELRSENAIIPFHAVTSAVQRTNEPVIALDFPPPALQERTYYGMLVPLLTKAASRDEVIERLRQPFSGFVLTSPKHVAELAAIRAPVGYRLLPPHTDRSQWAVALSWTSNPATIGTFSSTRRVIDFGDAEVDELHGLGSRVRSPKHPTLHYLEAAHAAIRLPGDLLLHRFGSELALNFHAVIPREGTLRVYLNEKELLSETIRTGDFKTVRFNAPPGVWQSGDNVLTLALDHADASTLFSDGKSFVALNWLTIRSLMERGGAADGTDEAPATRPAAETVPPADEESD